MDISASVAELPLRGWECTWRWGGQSQDRWPKLAKGMSHTIRYHDEQYNLERWRGWGWGGGCCCCFGTSWASVSRDWTTALCLTCFVYHLLLSLPFLFTIKLSIYQPMSFTYSPVLSSITMGDSTWTAVRYLAAYRVKLQQMLILLTY